MKPASRPFRARRGFVHMWAALMTMLFLALLGIALDTGYAYLIGHQLQNAADASALAGCLRVRHAPSYVETAAVELAAANDAARVPVTIYPDAGDLVIGTWSGGAFSTGGFYPNAVKVTTRRTPDVADGNVGLNFGTIFGTPSVPITRSAIAIIEDGGGAPALLVLDPVERNALTIAGSSTLRVTGGSVHVNSQNVQSSTRVGGNAAIYAPSLNIGGPLFDEGGAIIDALVNVGAPVLPDPLEYLQEILPANYGPTQLDSGSVLNPGYYPNGIQRSGGSITLNPGIYVLDGTPGNGGFKMSGSGTALVANGAMLYIVGGSFDVSSGVDITLTAPDPAVHSFPGVADYAGITVFQPSTNTRTSNLSLSGLMDFTGTFYFKRNQINVSASGGHVTARIIAWRLQFTGTGTVGVVFPGYSEEDKSVYLVK